MPLSPRDRRALIIAGAVMLVALIGFFLFVSKGTKEASPPATFTTQPQANPQPSPTSTPPRVLIAAGRDPFQPLVGPSPTSSPTTTPGTTGGTGTGTTGTGTTGTGTTGTGTSTSGTGTSGSNTTTGSSSGSGQGVPPLTG